MISYNFKRKIQNLTKFNFINDIEIIIIFIYIAFATHLEPFHQIDLINELHLHNTSYSGLSFDQNFYYFNPTIFLFGKLNLNFLKNKKLQHIVKIFSLPEDNYRSIRYSDSVYQRASYLISRNNEFTFIATVKQIKQNTGTIISFTEGINR